MIVCELNDMFGGSQEPGGSDDLNKLGDSDVSNNSKPMPKSKPKPLLSMSNGAVRLWTKRASRTQEQIDADHAKDRETKNAAFNYKLRKPSKGNTSKK